MCPLASRRRGFQLRCARPASLPKLHAEGWLLKLWFVSYAPIVFRVSKAFKTGTMPDCHRCTACCRAAIPLAGGPLFVAALGYEDVHSLSECSTTLRQVTPVALRPYCRYHDIGLNDDGGGD